MAKPTASSVLLSLVLASTAGAGYVHPGIMVSRSQLEAMRANVQAKRAPTYAAFRATMTTASRCTGNATADKNLNCNVSLGSLSYTPHPSVRVDGNSATAWAEKEDSGAAYTHALLWYITQDERHAEKAVGTLPDAGGREQDVRGRGGGGRAGGRRRRCARGGCVCVGGGS